MEGSDKIIQQISDKAKEEREGILEEARKKAENLKSAAQKKTDAEAKKVIREGEMEAEREKRRILASARTKARQTKLEAKEKLIQEVFETAKSELAKLRDDNQEYQEILENLIVSGGIAAGGGSLEVLVLRKDKELLSDDRVKELSKQISKETSEETSLNVLAKLTNATGGAIVQKSDGSIRCNNTFEARLERMKDSLRTEIAGMLFKT
ncbi:hypothetical protein AKJ44_01215 [candidate division MSBL1 archaeon SCGC-AAA261F17]|uniref:A-type ATP synthase subunit E n=1 Tax=candidate division MSBL1 archaeon SCGC-AAA261F17 TaxID=1698274 RepID=A0A133V6Y0_9EURY|nr:hypothetical protein AKJ44_01215 [candidate division MSBL1 archaeon SCGC-AAA261F17]